MLLLLSAAARLKCSSLCRHPPSSMARPSTSSMFPMIEPVSDAFTTSMWPSRSAMNARINSAAFPNELLMRPPRPGPTCRVRCSVPRPIRPASGMTARHETRKTLDGELSVSPSQMAIGTKMNSALRILSNTRRRLLRADGLQTTGFGHIGSRRAELQFGQRPCRRASAVCSPKPYFPLLIDPRNSALPLVLLIFESSSSIASTGDSGVSTLRST